MDSKGYLKSYGWQEGEALQKGGLKKPILVKHKKDKKGLGCAPGQDDSEASLVGEVVRRTLEKLGC